MREYPFNKPLIFDSHAHYDDSCFDENRDSLMGEMQENGVCSIITCGCDRASSIAAIELAEKYSFLYAAVGIHPDCISSGTSVYDIEELAANKKVVAIGEIGLDYFHNDENKPEQISLLKQQILLAKKLNLPVIIHDRDAHLDTLEILKEHKPKGVVHCFSGSAEMAKEILKLGMYIGVGGVITFKNARRLPEVMEMLPLERLLLETDAPYLAPIPFRGKQCNSSMIYYTAQKIAEIKGVSIEQVLTCSKQNAEKLFDIEKSE